MPKVLGNTEPEKLIPKLLKQAGKDKKIKYIINPPFTPKQMKQLEEIIEEGVREEVRKELGLPFTPKQMKQAEEMAKKAVREAFEEELGPPPLR